MALVLKGMSLEGSCRRIPVHREGAEGHQGTRSDDLRLPRPSTLEVGDGCRLTSVEGNFEVGSIGHGIAGLLNPG